MRKVLSFSILIVIILFAGCNSLAKYDDNEVAAIVRGKEITVGDLRFLYPDDTALDYLEGAIKVELVKQEVEKKELDISEHINKEKTGGDFAELPPKDTNDEDAKQIRKFAEAQAKKLDMKPKEFQREYAKRIEEQNAYMITYFEEELGEKFDDDVVTLSEEADELLDDLVEENQDEITILN